MDDGNADGVGARVLKRCFWIGIGYAAAVLTAAAISMIVNPLLAGAPPEMEGTLLLMLVAAPILGLKALSLAALAILVSEFTSLRTVVYFSLVGAAIGHVVADDFSLTLFDRDGAVDLSSLADMFAGSLAGVVYWRVTARRVQVGL